MFEGGDSNLYGYVGTVGKGPGIETNLYGYSGTVGKDIETNLYGYSFNDPINYIDPNGKFGIPLVLGVLAGVFYATDLNTPGAAQDELIGVPTAAASAAAGAAYCAVANTNRYLRIGMSRKGGEKVFRITGDLIGGKKIDLWNFGPL